ncbi:flagellar motor protein [Clostridium luticellarii]|jgi:chemotaxis protein MotA|uniref:Chemotaxis protein PomA n=1 Tax=Clostridium luticellarii TaxID=1691940 RepID=A0A2T0B846_9CLOT|nr:flagellar motor protein [Clostridium luticellarii]MCI1944892.1 flagellar motor protein [Clostridium luticellarii]MCI1968432.1 flagellar motor protein [Clostridium luticellarii]MCI1995430.1 flagellar motor protein [Clostridium luticellarii]MCI2039493.1 flagellar motor protein [Clostridium luticellarii]PRR80061.1 Chemotaxis protein PomA [Clostridium luticellarii]
MDISVIIFLFLGIISVVAGYMMEGGQATALLGATAAVIVFGGTIGATGLSFPMDILKRIPKMLKVLFSPRKTDLPVLISYFKDVSYKTRKNGLLSLEGEISNDPNLDPFIKKGLQLVVDGVDPQAVRSILELELDSTSERHKNGSDVFESAGGYAPTMGIVGTVMGLVHVLGNLEDTSTLGPKIAVAFLATLYGIGSANLLWLPIANRLKQADEKEVKEKTLIIEGILYIQEGINPNTIAEKLKSFLNKEELLKYESIDGKAEL